MPDFTLTRQIDGLTYHFTRGQGPDGSDGYKRSDGDHWIIHHPKWGWVAWDFAEQDVQGRPWNALPDAQSDNCPPEGIWVSRKGAKSYVYDLRHIRQSG